MTLEFRALENEIVLLKPLEKRDVGGILVAGSYPEIWTYLSTKIENEKDVHNFVDKTLQEKMLNKEFPFVIVDKKTGEIIGSTRFMDIDVQQQRLEIGFTWLTPSYWHTTVNTNCKYLLLSYCFEGLGLQRVQIKTDYANIRSQKAIERIGAVKEGILRNHMIRKDGTTRHTVMYSVIKEDWQEMKAHFKQLLK